MTNKYYIILKLKIIIFLIMILFLIVFFDAYNNNNDVYYILFFGFFLFLYIFVSLFKVNIELKNNVLSINSTSFLFKNLIINLNEIISLKIKNREKNKFSKQIIINTKNQSFVCSPFWNNYEDLIRSILSKVSSDCNIDQEIKQYFLIDKNNKNISLRDSHLFAVKNKKLKNKNE